MPHEQLHQDQLEPDAERGERRLVLRQPDALFLAHPLPQRGAVQRDQLRRPEPQALLEGRVPVQLLVRVEGVLGGGVEQPLGDLLPVLEQAECVAQSVEGVGIRQGLGRHGGSISWAYRVTGGSPRL
ncbi:hypothetical protein GCM10027073_65970 [Streptomyces chlorus]